MDTPEASTDDAVVVPAITPPSSLACLRSLRSRGVRTIAVSERETAAAFESKYCDERYLTPDPTTDVDEYADALLALAARPDVRAILPVREHDALVLAKHRSAFAEHVGTSWPDWETLRRVQDRIELYDVAESVDVAVPETQLFSECTNFDRELIVKARYTVPAEEFGDGDAVEARAAGGRTRYLRAGEEPPGAEIRFEMGHDPIVQAFMPGTDEYGFFAIYDHGEPLATFQHRQRRGYKYCGGPSAFRESVDIPALEAAGLRLLDALDWHGVAMVEFKRDPATGRFQLMEINPRFWSSLPFTVQAGADFPHYAWLLATDRADEIAPGYDVGVAGHLLRGELLYLHSVLTEEYPLVERPSFPAALRDVVASIVRHPRFDYADRDDPGPFLRDLRNLVAGTLDPKRTALSNAKGTTLSNAPGIGDETGGVEQSGNGESARSDTRRLGTSRNLVSDESD